MASAQRRTLPLFPGVEPAPSKPQLLAVRTLRTRVVNAALAWVRSGSADTFVNYARLRTAAEALDERLKQS